VKRCPQCNRVETDDSLTFCRTDGTPLGADTLVTSAELGTIRLGSVPVSGLETPTTLPPANTGNDIRRTTGPTTVLPSPDTRKQTRELSKPKNRTPLVVVAVLVVAAAIAVCAYLYFSKKKQVPIQSIAVMPFVNDSGDANNEYLSDGMTDTLISSLSQLPNLNVKARSSVFRYKGKPTNAQTIGSELNVQAILNGRMTQRGEQLTLSLELIDAQTENVIWSEQYNRKQTDLVTLQSEIARDVSSKLRAKLSGVDTEKLTKIYTTNPEAYRLYLQGRFYWAKREEKDLKQAIDSFNQAIALDANYAQAYTGLADSYLLMASFGFAPPTESVPKARGFALKALSLDETLAEPHTTLGLALLQFDYDLPAAEREYKRAIELNPGYATAHQWYGELLNCSGRFEESAGEFRRALEIEPASLPINWDYGRLLYDSRKYDESIAQHLKTLQLDPGFARARITLVEVYRVKKDYGAAIEELARYFEVRGQPENATLVKDSFAKGGWQEFLKLVVAEDSPLKERKMLRAKAYIELGDNDKAFAELNEAFVNHESSLAFLKVEPALDPLRSDPRFQDLLAKIHFSQ